MSGNESDITPRWTASTELQTKPAIYIFYFATGLGIKWRWLWALLSRGWKNIRKHSGTKSTGVKHFLKNSVAPQKSKGASPLPYVHI